VLPSRFQDRLSRGLWDGGFVPRSGASCGAVTGAPIRKRVIDARFLGASLSQAVMPHGTVGSVTLPRPVGWVPVLKNDANPAVGCRTDPWEPMPRNIRDAGFSASRTPAQVPRADVTLGNEYETASTKRSGFGGQRRRLLSRMSDSRPP